MEPLTDRQSRVLAFIAERIDQDGRPPTVREIASRFRMASTFGVRRHLEALQRKGYIRRDAHRSRGIRLAAAVDERRGIPIVGRVAAGSPILAVENIEGHLAIDSLFPRGAPLFGLRVQGDSMTGAGIEDGDYVIVRQEANWRNGRIGVAVVDGEATVKRLFLKGRFVHMRPENEAYQTIRVDLALQEFIFAGEVVGVHRVLKGTA